MCSRKGYRHLSLAIGFVRATLGASPTDPAAPPARQVTGAVVTSLVQQAAGAVTAVEHQADCRVPLSSLRRRRVFPLWLMIPVAASLGAARLTQPASALPRRAPPCRRAPFPERGHASPRWLCSVRLWKKLIERMTCGSHMSFSNRMDLGVYFT